MASTDQIRSERVKNGERQKERDEDLDEAIKQEKERDKGDKRKPKK